MAMSMGSIIEHLHVIVELSIGDITRRINSRLDPLLLQAAPKAIRPLCYPSSCHAGSYGTQSDAPDRSVAMHPSHLANLDLNESVFSLACVVARP